MRAGKPVGDVRTCSCLRLCSCTWLDFLLSPMLMLRIRRAMPYIVGRVVCKHEAYSCFRFSVKTRFVCAGNCRHFGQAPPQRCASLLCTLVGMGPILYQMLERCGAHADIIHECRDVGCRIRLISDGDVAAAIEVAKAGSAADIMFGIGGTPEGKQSASVQSSKATACSGHDC